MASRSQGAAVVAQSECLGRGQIPMNAAGR